MFSVQREAASIRVWASGKEQNVFCIVNCSFKRPVLVVKGCYSLYILQFSCFTSSLVLLQLFMLI